jgi:hypothetical protein
MEFVMDSVSNTVLIHTFQHEQTENVRHIMHGQNSSFYTKIDQIVFLMDSNVTHETCMNVYKIGPGPSVVGF